MRSDSAEVLRAIERERVRALLHVDVAAFDRVHAEDYQLCNPTGTIWTKADYLDQLTTGRVRYRRLAFTSEIDVLGAETIAVLRYRCTIAVRVAGEEIPEHECWHTDVYRQDGAVWRCTWSQATGIMDGRPATGVE